MQTPAIIPAEHAVLWQAARAWVSKITQALFVAGFTAVGDGKRPELIGWLSEVERIVRWLLIASALALRPDDILPDTAVPSLNANLRPPRIFGAIVSRLPAFLTLPAAPRPQPIETKAAAAPADRIAQQPRANAPMSKPRPLSAIDLGGQLGRRFFVLKRVIDDPARIIRRIALRFAARSVNGASTRTRAVIDWAADRLHAQPTILIHGLANAVHNAALDAIALYAHRDPRPG